MIRQSDCLPSNDEILDQAIAEFLRAEATGIAGEPQQWLRRFPECASGLNEFFEDRQQVDRLVAPMRLELHTDSGDAQASHASRAQVLSKVETIDFVPSAPDVPAGRYRPLRFHARGGMGEIWLAEDAHIGRKVAVKKLRSGRDVHDARFLIEAQVTGQLEHPSIVPLHDLGIDGAGQPYYVMKYIQGRRLTDAIADVHAAQKLSDWTAGVAFRQLLEILIDICNAVAFAHSKCVLHRDIKPDNVMLGEYGETLVLDWGLAKVIGEPDQPTGRSVRLSGSASVSATQNGAVVGSPYYMSPECAEQGAEAVDQASDVYLLGATLYEMLTASPPRQGSSQQELIDLARKARPANPRKLDPHIPRVLEAICLKAMAYRKQDRYPSATALATDLQLYLAGEPITAYQEPLVERVARWIRRHRRGLVRCVLTICALALIALLVRANRNAQTLAAREQARQDVAEYSRLADEAQYFAANVDALSERAPYYDPQRAIHSANLALKIADQWGPQAHDLPLVDQRAEVLKNKRFLLIQMARLSLLDQAAVAPDFKRTLSWLDEARRLGPPSRCDDELRTACLQALGDASAATESAQRVVAAKAPLTADELFMQAEMLRSKDRGSIGPRLQHAKTEAEHLNRAIDGYRQALDLEPRHYWARYQLGRCLLAAGRRAEGIEALGACIALRPSAPWAYSTRGLARALSGDFEPALVDLDRALTLDPNFQPARLNHGVACWLQATAARSPEQLEAATRDFNKIIDGPDGQLIEARFYRGQILLAQQRYRQALDDFSATIRERPDLAAAYWFRAQARFNLEEDSSARADIKSYVAQTEKLATTATKIALAKSLRVLATNLQGAARQRALALAVEELEIPTDGYGASAAADEQLGVIRELQGQLPAALDAYSHGLSLDPDHLGLRILRGWTYAKTDVPRACVDFDEAIRIAPQNAEAHTGRGYVQVLNGAADHADRDIAAALLTGADNYLVWHNVACIYAEMAKTNAETKRLNEDSALEALHKALSLWNQNAATVAANEFDLIAHEEAFSESLRGRAEFQQLLNSRVAP